jgi:deazaflavin-dependent oxidoreductase (nitroreductase family)
MAEESWNDKIIKEFRENEGRVGGNFEGAPLLLLHSIGAKSGVERINPMMYLRDGDRILVFASKAGAPTNPDWYYNLKANPRARIEIGTETCDVDATELEGTEHDLLYNKQAALYPGFRGYQEKTSRVIPVMALRVVS